MDCFHPNISNVTIYKQALINQFQTLVFLKNCYEQLDAIYLRSEVSNLFVELQNNYQAS